jgi:arylsulfatase A-like enzyme
MAKNILFITADQWRAECLSALGHQVQTPNLDQLAEQGVLFTQHYANAVPCGPSRACLHTGMYLQNHRSGTNGTPLDARHQTWAQEVRDKGYDPVLFGYTDTSNDPRFFDSDDPVLESYEGPLPGIKPVTMMGTYPNAWADWLESKGYEIPSPNWKLYTDKRGTEYELGGDIPSALAIPKEHHDTWFMVDQVIHYLDTHEDPFCIHLSLLRPHPPWVAPEPYNRMYPPDSLNDYIRHESRGAEARQHPWLDYTLQQPRLCAPVDQNRVARRKASSCGLMSEGDANLGRLFDYLKEQDLMRDTLIIFTSDHGEQIGDHHLLGKMGYFDQSYHIPLIVVDPSSKSDTTRGLRLAEFTENVDIMPTMLDWLDINIPVQCDGMSLLPATRTGTFPSNWRSEAHWEYDFRNVSGGSSLEQALGITQHQCSLNVVRGKQYKYVHFTQLPPLFFDLEEDPEELNNLAENPDYGPRVLEYAQKMLSWRMNHDEQTLTHLELTDKGVISRQTPRY